MMAADTDGDGAISEEEHSAWRASRPNRRGGPRGGDQQPSESSGEQ
jgi:hypothetical protein